MDSEKRKLPRFHITPCQFHDTDQSKNFSIQDISRGGVSLRLVERSDLPIFAVGTRHKGIVKVEGLKTEGSFQVKYLRGSPSDTLMEHLDSISEPKILGEHLKEYDLPALPNTLWLHNPIGVDLLFYKNVDAQVSDGNTFVNPIIRWTLYIHQSFVQWEPSSGLRTGKALAQDDEGYAHGIVQLETRLIEYDDKLDHRLAESALQVLEHAEVSSPELKTIAVNQLRAK
jgi:hypothetical protein